ncbi:MAG: hypothetical protein MR384_09880 [Lachnospiraceae bacterium]|nr:hypothetical protein [Lachnospiraceae bacterium]
MSNLIKSAFFNVEQEDKRIIDSDSHVEEFIPNIFSAAIENYGDDENDDVSFQDGEKDIEASYHDGMSVIRIDDVLEEEKQKLEEENRQKAAEILEEANEKASKIINEANENSDRIKKEAYEEGMNQGLSDGRQQAQEEADMLRKEFESECDKRMDQITQYENSLESKFADILIGLVTKITGIVCEDKKDVIIYLIDNALHNVSKSKDITIRVSKNDIMMVESEKDKFISGLSDDVSLDIVEDDSLSDNQCIIETESGVIDCSLDAQLDNLKEQLRLITM